MEYIGEISALATAFCWAITSYAFTDAIKRIGALQVNIDRMILASLMLFSIVIIFNLNLDLNYAQVSNLVISSIIGLVLGDSFLFKSFQLIGARLSIIVMASVPVLSTILAYFFLNELLSYPSIAGMLLTIIGIILVVFERRSGENKVSYNFRGISYGMLGALGQAGGLIFAKFAFQAGELNSFSASFIRLFSAFVIIFPLAIIFRKYKNTVRLYKKNKRAIKSVIIGTTFGPVLGITLSLLAIEFAKVGIASTLMATMPIIMLPIAKFYFKEEIGWKAIVGAIIAVAGTAIIFLK